jgi:uncharacterized membrane protein
MVGQTPKDTPFGLDANIAAGLAYLLVILGGIIMLAGGGTNRFVRWAAAQSITMWGAFFVVRYALGFASLFLHLWVITVPLFMVLWLLGLFLWLWTTITAFQGREVRVPFIADLTQKLFQAQLA